ncbi:hypothetical protein [Mucilaginibacter boryungensis]|uniref:O-antigen ligase-like membrane protein n=1 Tax=Mucilaginibacter boryungensis TaxID=768480 RepID=A0ABR9XG41_9SPHI|nr:hypothetical protein [Mucilaginibacter boryungensis]MBE9666359.1 hypothetical protein [Mucilaginibacter boryungensis]
MIKQLTLNFKKLTANVDWKLLLFLLLFLNIKLPIKIAALVLIYLLQFDLKFKLSFKNSRLPLFYLLIIPIAFTGLIVNQNYQAHHYMPIFFTGIAFWVLALLAMHQVKLMVERADTQTVHKTIIAFFIINAIFSLANLVFIIFRIHDINPYTFRGDYQKYFINTGDFIKGVTFDIAPTGAILNSFGVIYFLFKRNTVMSMLCMCMLMLTYNNCITIMLIIILLALFAFKSSRDQKSIIVVCIMLFGIFMIKVSPQNKVYLTQVIYRSLHIKHQDYVTPTPTNLAITQKPDNLLTFDERRQKFALHYLDSVNAAIRNKYGYRRYIPLLPLKFMKDGGIIIPLPDTNAGQLNVSNIPEPDRVKLLRFINDHKQNLPVSGSSNYRSNLPGKIAGAVQTIDYIKQHPQGIIAGFGVGCFSSKIAFRATGLGLNGGYPKDLTYIHPAFLSNHLDLYMHYFSKEEGFHSISNNPASVYDQLLAEYGLLGLLAFFICYLGYFLKRYKQLTYGLLLLFFLAMVLITDYWFEQLSIMIVFELLLFLNIKESEKLVNMTSHAS